MNFHNKIGQNDNETKNKDKQKQNKTKSIAIHCNTYDSTRDHSYNYHTNGVTYKSNKAELIES